jgi:hypothetical protein
MNTEPIDPVNIAGLGQNPVRSDNRQCQEREKQRDQSVHVSDSFLVVSMRFDCADQCCRVVKDNRCGIAWQRSIPERGKLSPFLNEEAKYPFQSGCGSC